MEPGPAVRAASVAAVVVVAAGEIAVATAAERFGGTVAGAAKAGAGTDPVERGGLVAEVRVDVARVGAERAAGERAGKQVWPTPPLIQFCSVLLFHGLQFSVNLHRSLQIRNHCISSGSCPGRCVAQEQSSHRDGGGGGGEGERS